MSRGSGFRVATWNIHSAIGADGRHDPGRILAGIRALDAQVTALQEVDSRINGRNGFLEFRADGRHAAAEAKTVVAPNGEYGHMLLSRWPIERCRTHDLSMAGREPRSAIDAVLDTGEGPLRVIATHLGLFLRERRRQVRILARLLDQETDLPTIVLGDFNEPTGRGPASRRFAPRLARAGRWRTYPSRRPVLPLDRIWYSPNLALVGSRVAAEARSASDHLPLVAEFSRRPGHDQELPVSGRDPGEP
jgi:endonuclease/exonuclease/phosphatase family metal-dependent hydrolase